jgi:transcriptional regulator GlxA family with amidase domain
MRVHSNRRLPLAEVASVAHMSQFHFSRSFHRIVGVTFQDHLVGLRLRHAEHLLRRDPSAPLRRVAAQTGFGTLRNLQDHYRRCFGYPPSHGRARERYATLPWGDARDAPPFARETA